MENEFFVKNPDSWLVCVSHCQDLLEEGATLKITVKDARKRSLSQNALLFMWYGELSTQIKQKSGESYSTCLLYTSPSPRDRTRSRMPSSA